MSLDSHLHLSILDWGSLAVLDNVGGFNVGTRMNQGVLESICGASIPVHVLDDGLDL